MPPLRPMLATKASSLPTGPEWAHEVKWDGVRILADLSATHGGTARLWSRNANEVGVAWPDVVDSPVGARDLLVPYTVRTTHLHCAPTLDDTLLCNLRLHRNCFRNKSGATLF